MAWEPDVNGDTFKRDDGTVVERSSYSGDSWEVIIRDASDVRCKLRNKQGHTRRWKSPEAAMKATDKEFPVAAASEPAPELQAVRGAPPRLSSAERMLLERVRQSDGGCFPGVGDVAAGLVERGLLTGAPVKNYPGYWQLRRPS